jgi:hypothetical protein
MACDRLGRDALEKLVGLIAQGKSSEDNRGQTIESAHAERRINRAVVRIQSKRVQHQPIGADEYFIAACETPKSPTLTARYPARAQPVHQHKTSARFGMKLLLLLVNRISEALNGIRREDKQRARSKISAQRVAAGKLHS